MGKTRMEKSVRIAWTIGNCVLCPSLVILWWRMYESQTFAQASHSSLYLGLIAAFTGLWGAMGSAWLTKLKRARLP